MKTKRSKIVWRPVTVTFFLILPVAITAGGFLLLWHAPWLTSAPTNYVAEALVALEPETPKVPEFVVTHLPTPEPLKALYLTSWAAGTKSFRDHILKLTDETEINSLVIDIKDYSGRIAFPVINPVLIKIGSQELRIPDVKEFIGKLHKKGIYVIGRVAVFQDAFLVAKRPELAVKRESDNGVWRDRKGIPWLDAGAREVWDYTIAISRDAYAVGFDEINFDYIRFPSDGDMKDIAYTHFNSASSTRVKQMEKFFKYLDKGLNDLPLPTSVDLFGLTTSSADDLGIGQKLEIAAPYFDYIAPMVYPSHYASGYLGFANPATKPYEVVKNSLDLASLKLLNASSSPQKLRPWLQDFDLGADYTAEMVRAQIQAVYDAGLTSWMLWDPSNKYTVGGLDK